MRKLAVISCVGLMLGVGSVSAQSKGSDALPHVIVYKAKSAYRNLVPVMLSKDRSAVESYPDPSDINTGSAPSGLLPVSLHKGYYLDKKGVGANTAFIKLSYQEYGKLKTAPSATELYKMIVDKNPIRELCDCGVRNEKINSSRQINEWIDKGLLKKKCKVIKK